MIVRADDGLDGLRERRRACPTARCSSGCSSGVDPLRTEVVREVCETVDFHGGRPGRVEVAVLGSRRPRARQAASGSCSAAATSGCSPTRRAASCVEPGGARAPRAWRCATPACARVKIRFHHADWRDDVARRRGGARRGRRRLRDHGRREPGLADAGRPRAALGRRDRGAVRARARAARRLLARGAAADRRPRRLPRAARRAPTCASPRARWCAARTRRATCRSRRRRRHAARRRARRRHRRLPPHRRARRAARPRVVAAHVVERLRPRRQPARRARRSRPCPFVEVPYDPPAWSAERRDLLLPRADRDRRRRDDRAARRARARRRARTSTRSSSWRVGVRIARRCCASRAGRSRSSEVELDPPRAGEVLVRVAAAGVCHSDVHLADGELGDGRWPMVLGHEGAGVVEAVGRASTHVAPGDHVAFCFVPVLRALRAVPGRAAEPVRGRPASTARRDADGRHERGCRCRTATRCSTA